MSREHPRVLLEKRNGTTYVGSVTRTPIGAMPDILFVDGVPYVWSPHRPSTPEYVAIYTQAVTGEWEPGDPDETQRQGDGT